MGIHYCAALAMFVAVSITAVLIFLPSFAIAIEKVVIDTDAGGDDAVAILLAVKRAAKDPNSEILAITCVAGNTKVDNVVINVLKTLITANSTSIPVYKGAEQSILHVHKDDDWFGQDGLGDFEFPNSPTLEDAQKEHAVQALVRLVKENPGEITLLTLGPLTNIALAIRLDPNFRKNIKKLVVMGGSVEGYGNMQPGVEYNFMVDPEAVHVVFNSTEAPMAPIDLYPWETILLRATTTMKWRNEVLGIIDSPLINFLNKAEIHHLNDTENWLAVDAHAALVTLWPSSVTDHTTVHISAVLQGEMRGSIQVDYTGLTSHYKNVRIIRNIDVKFYENSLITYLSVL